MEEQKRSRKAAKRNKKKEKKRIMKELSKEAAKLNVVDEDFMERIKSKYGVGGGQEGVETIDAKEGEKTGETQVREKDVIGENQEKEGEVRDIPGPKL